MTTDAIGTEKPRVHSLDWLRLCIMLTMIIDHTRAFFSSEVFRPAQIPNLRPELFWPKIISHYSTAQFFILLGVCAGISYLRKGSRSSSAQKWLVRGLFLIVLELTVVRFAWRFNLDYSMVYLQAIWALGWSCVVLAIFAYLPRIICLTLIAAVLWVQNYTDYFLILKGTWFWHLLFLPGYLRYEQSVVLVQYPLIPWIFIPYLGWQCATLFRSVPGARAKQFFLLSTACFALFVLSRWWIGGGNPVPWKPNIDTLKNIASFLYTTKYPPSIDYLLASFGIFFGAVAVFELARPNAVHRWLRAVVRQPLFFYCAHLCVIHLSAVSFFFLLGKDVLFLFGNEPRSAYLKQAGVSLEIVAVLSLVHLLIMVLLCNVWSYLKKRVRDPQTLNSAKPL